MVTVNPLRINSFIKSKVKFKARRDMSERGYKVGSMFLQNGDFVGKRDAKFLERDRGDVTVGTKNRRNRASKTRLSQPLICNSN